MRAKEARLSLDKLGRREGAKWGGRGRTSVPGADWDRDPKVSGPKEDGNEIRRWEMMIMMSPVVAPAESKMRPR